MNNRPLAPRGGNDDVYTPEYLAKQIIAHFNPSGPIMEPCRGTGSFYNNFPTGEDHGWFELSEGKDFLASEVNEKYNWVITNPPWSKIRPFLDKSMIISDNVVFLCLVNAFFMKARLRDIKVRGFGIKEILCVKTPPKPWPQTGFQLGAVHIQRGYEGDIKFTHE